MRKFFFVVIAFIVFIVLVPVIIVTREEVRIEGDDVNEDSDATEIEVIESDLMIKVYNHRTSEIMSLYLEDYIVNVVAAEMPASFELEALKAQAVASGIEDVATYVDNKLGDYASKVSEENDSEKHVLEKLIDDPQNSGQIPGLNPVISKRQVKHPLLLRHIPWHKRFNVLQISAR